MPFLVKSLLYRNGMNLRNRRKVKRKIVSVLLLALLFVMAILPLGVLSLATAEPLFIDSIGIPEMSEPGRERQQPVASEMSAASYLDKIQSARVEASERMRDIEAMLSYHLDRLESLQTTLANADGATKCRWQGRTYSAPVMRELLNETDNVVAFLKLQLQSVRHEVNSLRGQEDYLLACRTDTREENPL